MLQVVDILSCKELSTGNIITKIEKKIIFLGFQLKFTTFWFGEVYIIAITQSLTELFLLALVVPEIMEVCD